jgi:phage FluMu protein Com
MPIRFRCAYCNQLMAIAHRKAGTVVRCPTCAGQVVVPSAEAAQQAPAKKGENPKPALFERSDFDELFQDPAPPVPPGPAPGFAPVPGPAPGFPGQDYSIEPVPLVAPPGGHSLGSRQAGLVLSPAKATALFLIVVLLLGVSFIAGLLVGRAGP